MESKRCRIYYLVYQEQVSGKKKIKTHLIYLYQCSDKYGQIYGSIKAGTSKRCKVNENFQRTQFASNNSI